MPSKRDTRASLFDGLFTPPSDTTLSEHDRALFGDIRRESIIVAEESGVLRVGAFRLTPTGMTVDSNTPALDDWEQVGVILRKLEGSIQWLIGDWFVQGEHLWGSIYSSKAQALGFEEKTLRDYAYVARNVKLSIRIDNLAFAHHQVIAAETPEMQPLYLEYAHVVGVTVSNLRADRRLLKEFDDTMEESLLRMAIKQRTRITELEPVRKALDASTLTKALPVGDQAAIKRLLSFSIEHLNSYDRDQLRGVLKTIDAAREAVNQLEHMVRRKLDEGGVSIDYGQYEEGRGE